MDEKQLVDGRGPASPSGRARADRPGWGWRASRRWARLGPLALALALMVGMLAPGGARHAAADTGPCGFLLFSPCNGGGPTPPSLLNIPTQAPISVISMGSPPPFPPLYLATAGEASTFRLKTFRILGGLGLHGWCQSDGSGSLLRGRDTAGVGPLDRSG